MIVPILHRIVVQQDKLEETDEVYRKAKAAGIALVDLVDKSREQAAIDTGRVVSIGPTAFKDFGADTTVLSIGDTVVFAKYAGKVVIDPSSKERYVLLNDEDVVCLLKD